MKSRAVRWFVLLILALITLACSPCGLLGGRNTTAPTAVPLPTEPPPTEAPPAETEIPPTAAPTATPPPEVEPPPGWRMYTNGNAVRQIAQADDGTLWAATGGGAVAWDLASGEATVYTVLDGLPVNDLHAVVVCPIPEPRVVFGSDEGLALYDPASGSWEEWTAENSGLESDEVGGLNCDPDSNTLLVTYDWGVGTFDAAAGEWRHLTTDDGLASDWANDIFVVDGEIWVASDSGVSVVHTDGDVTIYDEETSDIPDERVEAIVADGDGTIWLAGSDGLLAFQDGAWTQYNKDNVEEFPFLDAFEDVLAAPDGTIWVGNGFGEICQFDPAAETCLEIYDSQEGMADDLNDLLLDDQGTLTYCGDQGISTFDGGSWRSLVLDELPASNVYDAITQTPDGTIWVGGAFGLQRFPAEDPDGAWDHDEMEGYRVNTFHLGQEGLWIGHGGGASYAEYAQLQQPDTWTDFEAVDEPGQGVYGGISAITEDGSGRVWFGGSGLTVWDGETYTYYDLLTDEERTDGDSPGFAHGLLYDGTGVWVSTWGRLLYFDENDEVTMWDQLPVGGTPYVEAMALDTDGQVLLADANRLLTYAGGTFTERAEVGDTVMSILVDETGGIWLGLEDQGVSHYDGSQWSSMTTADGLPTNQFGDESILVDNLGAIWFAGRTGGLARYAP
ncbi:MAG: two-component regulator propeller domain-containing protein [Anaerolineae bacterium]